MAQAQSRTFLDGMLARLIALALAAGFAFLLYDNWADEIRQFVDGGVPEVSLPGTAERISVKPVNDALQACLDKRIGDVDGLKADGVITEAQYDKFRARAVELCQAQNPS